MITKIDHRYLRYFDFISFFITLIIAGIGLLFVFSSTYKPESPHSLFLKKQAWGMLSGIFIYSFFCCADYRLLLRWGYFLYLTTIGFLIFTLIKGSFGMGAQRWINIALFKFQPSEITKLFFPAFLSYHLYKEHDTRTTYTLSDFSTIIVVLFCSFFLIAKQPDLGTALVVTSTGLVVLWVAGVNKNFFIALFLIALVSTPLSHHLLKSYQKKRLTVFLGQGDATKERYQLEQSKIAVGSGGLAGKGFLNGTQNKLMFLPESRNDFIFSVIAEEWGFIGSVIILILYSILFMRIFYLILLIKNLYAQLLALGLMMHILISCIINIAMVIGLLPVVGVPLPLISSGISNLWITFASLGWINGIIIRQSYVGD